MAKIGAALKKNHRKINQVPCCIDNNTQALFPIKVADIDYLFYLMKCIDMGWFDNAGAVPSVNNQKFLNSFIPNVPMSEQKEIAKYLEQKCSAIDSLLSSKEHFLEEMEAYRKSLIYEYVTGKKEVAS